MITGIAIYHTENISAINSLNIGLSFFEAVGVSVNAATYNQLLNDGDHVGDHQLSTISVDRLQENVLNRAYAFGPYHERKGSTP
ncbi:hypothetical protein [Lysinibacillus sp. 38-6]|uniref:hypothetical protein n=1 Tax=Lysinibacillus sp. 38-6 TaxID=3385991 RepID=UPI003908B90A